jgi:Fic family protein
MILFELTESEDHPVYQALEVSNGNRQYDFLRSIVQASIDVNKRFLSQSVIKALNFHAISCLHTNAGEYRPCQVYVGPHTPPAAHRVQALMDDFVNVVNTSWQNTDPLVIAAYALWRLNYIHPFINGNGRTARVTCYFVLCLANGGWLPGQTTLPQLIKRERDRYVEALRLVDQVWETKVLNLAPLHALLAELLQEQLNSVGIGLDPAADPPADPAAA